MIFEIDFKGNTASEVTMRRSWALTRESSYLTFGVYTASGVEPTMTMKFKTNVWYHLTFTATVVKDVSIKGFERTELKMYVNSRPLKKCKFDKNI